MNAQLSRGIDGNGLRFIVVPRRMIPIWETGNRNTLDRRLLQRARNRGISQRLQDLSGLLDRKIALQPVEMDSLLNVRGGHVEYIQYPLMPAVPSSAGDEHIGRLSAVHLANFLSGVGFGYLQEELAERPRSPMSAG